MSKLSRCMASIGRAARSEQHDPDRPPFSFLRGIICGKPAAGIQALDARNIARPALQSIALLLMIVIAMMAMVKQAQADPAQYKAGNATGVYSSAYLACSAAWAVTGFTPAQLCPGVSSSSGYCWSFSGTNSTGTTCLSNCASDGRGQCPNPPIGFQYQVIVTCAAGYQLDLAKTSCVPEPLTIALSGLGGDVMPNQTRAAYALVAASTGAPKSGIHVDLFHDVVPELKGQLPVTYTGILVPGDGFTDANGRMDFEFRAPTAGGTHTITATCTGCTNQATGTIKVSGCPVPPLSAPPFTDPVAQGFENGNRWRPDLLTATYQTKLACVEAAIDAATGMPQSYTGTSAYRPTEYQQHLYEIIKKDVKLKPTYMLAHPECQALRNKVTGEMSDHGLKYKQKVAEPGSSRHESGTAFDLAPHGLTNAQLAPIYAGCGVSHTAVSSEPWHIQ